MTVRAASVVAERAIAVGEISLPAPGAGQVRVRVTACGICGSNLHLWERPALSAQRGVEPRPGADGHEIAAVVAEIGSGVTGLAPGDQVCIEPRLASACGTCEACRRGSAWYCGDQTPLACWGFSEQMIVPAQGLLKPAVDVPPALLTLAEPLAVAVHALRSSTAGLTGSLRGSHVAIVGAGAAGLLAITAARHLGAARVSVVARHPHQAVAAKELGADRVLGPDDPVADLGADLAVEAVGGSADSLSVALSAVRARGEVVVIGIFDEPQSISSRRVTYREARLYFPVTYGVQDGVRDFDLALEVLIREQDSLAGLITHTMPLADVAEAFELAANKKAGALRVVVTPPDPAEPINDNGEVFHG